MLIILDDMMSWVRVVEVETEGARTAEDIARQREDCISLMQIKTVLEAFPTGSTLYNPKKYAYRPSDPTSADYQRLVNFWMSTDFVLWEVRTKVTIIKKYILIAGSWNKLLAVGQTLNKLRSYFPGAERPDGVRVGSPRPGETESPRLSSSPTTTSPSPLSSPSPRAVSSSTSPSPSPRVPGGGHQRQSSLGGPPRSAAIVAGAGASPAPAKSALSASSPAQPSPAAGGGGGDTERRIVRKQNSGGLVSAGNNSNNGGGGAGGLHSPSRRRLTHLFDDPLSVDGGDHSSGSSGESVESVPLTSEDPEEAERRRQQYIQRDKTINKLTKGAGISKNRADRFKDLLREMQLDGDASAFAGGIVALAIAKKSRVERLRGAGAQQRPYHAGPMMLFSKSWKKMWCTVSEHGLKLYPTAKCDKLAREVMIGEIVCIGHQDKVAKEGQQDYIELSLVCESQLCLAAPTPADNIKWILAIDGMKDRSILTTAQKLSLLRARHFIGVRGGSIKSADDEEWIYNGKTGELSILDGLLWEGRKVEVSYTWNGQTLVPTRVAADGTFADETEAQRIRQSGFGSGVWDGVTLIWHRDGGANMRLQDFSLMQADFTYLWDEQEREFVNDESVDRHWKFSRHFLASKSNHGHWIVEGDIPEPVVMGLQLMRYTRLGVPASQ